MLNLNRPPSVAQRRHHHSSAGELIRVHLFPNSKFDRSIANCVSLAENVHQDACGKSIPSIAEVTVRFCHNTCSALIERVLVVTALIERVRVPIASTTVLSRDPGFCSCMDPSAIVLVAPAILSNAGGIFSSTTGADILRPLSSNVRGR